MVTKIHRKKEVKENNNKNTIRYSNCNLRVVTCDLFDKLKRKICVIFNKIRCSFLCIGKK